MCVETDRTIVLRLQGRRSGRTTKRPQRQTRSVSDCDEEKCGCQACCLDQYRYRCVFLTSFRHFVLRLRGEHREEVSAGDVLADQIVEGLCLDLIVEARDALLALGDRVEELLLDGEGLVAPGCTTALAGRWMACRRGWLRPQVSLSMVSVVSGGWSEPSSRRRMRASRRTSSSTDTPACERAVAAASAPWLGGVWPSWLLGFTSSAWETLTATSH